MMEGQGAEARLRTRGTHDHPSHPRASKKPRPQAEAQPQAESASQTVARATHKVTIVLTDGSAEQRVLCNRYTLMERSGYFGELLRDIDQDEGEVFEIVDGSCSLADATTLLKWTHNTPTAVPWNKGLVYMAGKWIVFEIQEMYKKMVHDIPSYQPCMRLTEGSLATIVPECDGSYLDLTDLWALLSNMELDIKQDEPIEVRITKVIPRPNLVSRELEGWSYEFETVEEFKTSVALTSLKHLDDVTEEGDEIRLGWSNGAQTRWIIVSLSCEPDDPSCHATLHLGNLISCEPLDQKWFHTMPQSPKQWWETREALIDLEWLRFPEETLEQLRHDAALCVINNRKLYNSEAAARVFTAKELNFILERII